MLKEFRVNQELLIKINEVTGDAHKQVDSEIAKVRKACQKGCSSCCHQIVDVFTWEEPKIFEFIFRKFDRKKKRELARNLKRWFKIFNKHTRDASRSDPLSFDEIRNIQHVFRENKVACPFLIGSSCSIYDVRPMVCRVHYQADTSENCQRDPHLTTPIDAQNVFHEASNKFDPEIFPRATKPLAYLVAEEFGDDIQSKPMVGIIYDPNNMFGRI